MKSPHYIRRSVSSLRAGGPRKPRGLSPLPPSSARGRRVSPIPPGAESPALTSGPRHPFHRAPIRRRAPLSLSRIEGPPRLCVFGACASTDLGAASQFLTASAMNFGPLSHRMNSGSPRTSNRDSSADTTSSALRLLSASIVRHGRGGSGTVRWTRRRPSTKDTAVGDVRRYAPPRRRTSLWIGRASPR